MNKLEETMRAFVTEGKAAGVSALITDHGHETAYCAYGVKDLASASPFARDTLCCIYSMTKIFTTVTFLTLVEKGLVTVDTPLSEICPDYAYQLRVRMDGGRAVLTENDTPITFRHLLTMTSGYPYDGVGANAGEELVQSYIRPIIKRMNRGEETGIGAYTAARFAREMADVPLLFRPGTAWHYGLSLDIVGGMIEMITGKSLESYMKEAVLDPLGLADTFFTLPEEKKPRLASVYTLATGTLQPWHKDPNSIMVFNRVFCAGGAGLISSIDDCARFGSMLAMGGELDGVRILRPETVREMTSDMLPDPIKPSFNWLTERGYTYGLGVRVMHDPAKSDYAESIGSFGWNGMAGTSLRIFPDRGRACVFFIQLVPAMHENYLPAFVRAVNTL